MKKTLIALALLVGNAHAAHYEDLDLITAKSGEIEINTKARDRAEAELNDLQKQFVVETSITFQELNERGESLLQNVIMRARDRLLRLHNRFIHKKGITQERIDNNFYKYRFWNVIESKWEEVIVFNPSDARPQGAGFANIEDVRNYKRMIANMQSGLLLKEIAHNGAHFSYFTDNQNDVLTVYAKDKENGIRSKLERIEYLQNYIAGFEVEANARKQLYDARLEMQEYYINDGYVMPRVP